MEVNKKLLLGFLLLYQFSLVFPLSDEGKALMSVKASLNNVANKLLDWDAHKNEVYCSWRGVSCDTLSFSVIYLNLSNLDLGGEISPSIGELPNLQTIDFNRNNLTGKIPDEIGNCLALQYLDLSGNSLYGDIPFSISNLKQLQHLDFALNQLTGEIPRLIHWNELQYLNLRDNLLTENLTPDMCQLTALWYFDVRGNNLTGTIPESIGNCTSYKVLDISNNQVTGEIPDNIGFLQVAYLSFESNKLTGKIPESIGLMQSLGVLDLSGNELIGPIPARFGNLSYIYELLLQGNKLSGLIPPELGNISYIGILKLNDNHLVGGIPAELGKLGMLFQMKLENNYLEGPIPPNISSCTALTHFNVYGNKLNGSIPSSFQHLQYLTHLNLSSNKFEGRVPMGLGRIINLDTLDLSCNNFSGPVPTSVGDLEHLLTLNLSRNHLDGPVPVEFGNLGSIQILDMSVNKLSGKIPEELGQLQNINTLLLSNNNLHGEVPMQLINCFSLVILDLSQNNLSGVIPYTRNLTRFPHGSFAGNPLLCVNRFGSTCMLYSQKPRVFISRTAIVCLISTIIVLLLMAIVAVYRFNRPNQLMSRSSRADEGPPKLVILHKDMAIHTYEDIMRITEDLDEKYIIGYGASSTVYKCILTNSKTIAIKRLSGSDQLHNQQAFETELETIGSIKHRNLVSLNGYILLPNGYLIFFDYMQNGSLKDLLHGRTKLDWNTRLKLAVGAAQGLAYLHHDCNPRIIHRDVKSANILVDDNFEAHVSDFGISKFISSSKTHASTFVKGTIGYIDPVYAQTCNLNEKSDVYSFGVVLLELLTGKKAIENELNLQQLIQSKAEDNTMMEAVDPEMSATSIDLVLIEKTFQLALLCTRRKPADRPTMREVVTVLASLLPPPPTTAYPTASYPDYGESYGNFVASVQIYNAGNPSNIGEIPPNLGSLGAGTSKTKSELDIIEEEVGEKPRNIAEIPRLGFEISGAGISNQKSKLHIEE